MFRLISRARAHGRLALAPRRVVAHRYNSSKASDPLRILFCGSDAFSCESLRALHREHVHNRALIEALDVMVLPGKRTGRGLKTVRQGETDTVFSSALKCG
jgi:methionyl-tRNA formyltransferase